MPEAELEGLEVDDESGVHGRVDPAFVIQRHLLGLNSQLLKLPHESILPGSNISSGVTYEDIKQSFVDGVRILIQIVLPIEKVRKDAPKLDQKIKTFDDALEQYGKVIDILDMNNMFYPRAKTVILDEEGGAVYESEKPRSKKKDSADE